MVTERSFQPIASMAEVRREATACLEKQAYFPGDSRWLQDSCVLFLVENSIFPDDMPVPLLGDVRMLLNVANALFFGSEVLCRCSHFVDYISFYAVMIS